MSYLTIDALDGSFNGFITISQLFDFIEENTYSVLAPYIERFFNLIDREATLERVNFEELFPALVMYCMFTRNEMIAFVFSMLDTDKDERLS